MAFSGIIRSTFCQWRTKPGLSQHILSLSLQNTSATVNKTVLPIASCIQRREYRRKIDVSHLKPLNYDHSEDLVGQADLDSSEILFKYKNIPDIDSLPDNVRKLFTVEFASSREKLEHRNMVLQDKITDIVGPGLCLEKQLAYLTVKIRNMIPYIKNNRQNKNHKHYLEERIAKRKKLLGYLRMLDYDRYIWLLKELKITYTPYNKHAYHRLSKKALITKGVRDTMWAEQKEKLNVIKERFETEKVEFLTHKQQVLDEIDEDIQKYGLDKTHVIKEYMKVMEKKQEANEVEGRKPQGSKKIKEYIKLSKERKEREGRVV